jgi:hypothetical protein
MSTSFSVLDSNSTSGGRSFLHSLNSMFVDPAEVERKRRQQEQLAETLRQQIIERRQAKELERQTIERRLAAEEAFLAQAAAKPPNPPQPTDPVSEAPPEQKPKRLIPLLKRQFAATLPTPKPLSLFQISTESPFAHSTVPTPPPGFSRTRPHESTQNWHQREPDLWNEPVRRSMPSRLLNPMITRGKVEQTVVRLGTNSELIYPDGHMSPISSPRGID